jgi:hypothetical protein
MASVKTRNILDGSGSIITTRTPAGKTHQLIVLGENVQIPASVRTITGILQLAERVLPVIREARQAAVLKMLADQKDDDGGYDIVPAPRDDTIPMAEIKIVATGVITDDPLPEPLELSDPAAKMTQA